MEKPRILLIADCPNWIFHRHTTTLKRYLSEEFEFSLSFMGQPFEETKYDLIYPLEFNLVDLNAIQDPTKYVTGIRSHISYLVLGFGGKEIVRLASSLRKKFQKVHVVSQRLFDLFEALIPGLSVVSHGVDTTVFQPNNPLQSANGTLRLGWAGNRNEPTKGFEEYIEPLGHLGGVELVSCGYSDTNLPLEQMPSFYESIDAFASASLAEGNNNCLLEAASMQRAIITTDTGTVPEYLRNGVSALIVDRNLESFVGAVERIRDDPDFRVSLGKQARKSVIEKWDWVARAEEYRAFFREALKHRTEGVSRTQWNRCIAWNDLPLPTSVAFLTERLDFEAHRRLQLEKQIGYLKNEIDRLSSGKVLLENSPDEPILLPVDWAARLRERSDLNAELTQELSAIKRSRSWRWTRPVANIYCRIRNLGKSCSVWSGIG